MRVMRKLTTFQSEKHNDKPTVEPNDIWEYNTKMYHQEIRNDGVGQIYQK